MAPGHFEIPPPAGMKNSASLLQTANPAITDSRSRKREPPVAVGGSASHSLLGDLVEVDVRVPRAGVDEHRWGVPERIGRETPGLRLRADLQIVG